MEARLNLGIIGIGTQGKRLLEAFSSKKEVAVTHYVSTGNSQNIEWINKHSPHTQPSSYEDILADNEVDAVIIATPIETHYALVRKALVAKKHVFVEKPLATATDEIEELLKLSKENNLTLFVGYTFLYSPVFKKVEEVLKDTPVEEVSFVWNKYGSFKENILWNLLTHELSIAITLFGNPEKVNLSRASGVVTDLDTCSLNAKFKEGTTATFLLNRAADTVEKEVTIITEREKMIWKNNTLQVYQLSDLGNPSLTFSPKETPLEVEINTFLELLEAKKGGGDGKLHTDISVIIQKIESDLLQN